MWTINLIGNIYINNKINAIIGLLKDCYMFIFGKEQQHTNMGESGKGILVPTLKT